MIAYDFEYYKPSTIDEAITAFKNLDEQGKKPVYYGGGTEIISMARANNIHMKSVIDIKDIPECKVLEYRNDKLVIGSAVTLTRIDESKMFPLLGNTVSRIADHTIQDKITLGGNIAGTIIYRESVLPLLISDSQIVIAGESGLKTLFFSEVFNETLKLNKGELIIQIIIDKQYTVLPFLHVKKTTLEKIDYPLFTVVAVKKGERIRAAFSGLYSYPFRSIKVEDELSNTNLPTNERIKNALNKMTETFISDIHGTDEYRKFVLEYTLEGVLANLEGVR